MRSIITLTLPWPPTVNTYWRRLTTGRMGGRVLISEKGRAYRESVLRHLAGNGIGTVGAERVRVDIEARPPDRRQRDLDNLPKAILDALTHGGLWEDDSQIDDLRIWRSTQCTGEVVITITPLKEAA